MGSRLMVLIAALLCVRPLPAQSARADLKSGKREIRSLVLMPIQVNLNKVSLKGMEPMLAEASDTEIPLALEIEAALRNLGYQLDQTTLSHAALAKNTDIGYIVDDLQRRFDSELGPMQRKSKDVRKGRFSLGDDVARLPLSNSVDALLFVRASGRVLTDNKKAFGYLVAGSTSDKGLLEIGFVDAKTGSVLYFAKSKVEGDITYDSESIASSLEKALRNLPRAGPRSVSDQQTLPPIAPVLSTGAPDTASQPRRIRVSHVVLKSMLISAVKPQYPGIASMNYVDGDVVMRVVIDTQGRVAEVKTTTGPIQLIPAATSAVKQWRYRPLMLNGQVFEADTDITFKFSMSQ